MSFFPRRAPLTLTVAVLTLWAGVAMACSADRYEDRRAVSESTSSMETQMAGGVSPANAGDPKPSSPSGPTDEGGSPSAADTRSPTGPARTDSHMAASPNSEAVSRQGFLDYWPHALLEAVNPPPVHTYLLEGVRSGQRRDPHGPVSVMVAWQEPGPTVITASLQEVVEAGGVVMRVYYIPPEQAVMYTEEPTGRERVITGVRGRTARLVDTSPEHYTYAPTFSQEPSNRNYRTITFGDRQPDGSVLAWEFRFAPSAFPLDASVEFINRMTVRAARKS